MKKFIFLFLIFGLLSPAGLLLAQTPNIISAKANPGVTVAILEGSVNPGGATTTAWFEYGTTESLNNYKETTHIHIGSSSYATPFKASLTELEPNTTYYFRLASDNGINTAKGKTFSFTTMKDEYLTEKNNLNSENNNDEISDYNVNENFEITTNKKEVNIGEEVQFLITFKNNTSRSFENTKITVELPKGIKFKESNFGNEDNNTITLEAETIIPDQLGSLSVKGIITSEAVEKDLLITTAVLSYEIKGTGRTEEKVDYATNKVESKNSLGASANIGGNTFLPNTLIDWLTLILVVSGLVLVGRNLYKDMPFRKEVVVDRNH